MELKTQKDIDDFFDSHQQKGLDELQKFFDNGGKLDFSDPPDNIEKIIKKQIEKSDIKPVNPFCRGGRD